MSDEVKNQHARNIFDQEIEALKREGGEDASERSLLVFSKALYWLRKWGHGNLVISAVDHSFGLKIRADTVFSIKDK